MQHVGVGSAPAVYRAVDTNSSCLQKSTVQLSWNCIRELYSKAIIIQTLESGRNFLGEKKLSVFSANDKHKLQAKISFRELKSLPRAWKVLILQPSHWWKQWYHYSISCRVSTWVSSVWLPYQPRQGANPSRADGQREGQAHFRKTHMKTHRQVSTLLRLLKKLPLTRFSSDCKQHPQFSERRLKYFPLF